MFNTQINRKGTIRNITRFNSNNKFDIINNLIRKYHMMAINERPFGDGSRMVEFIS
jgi:hypothetical protein